MALKMHSEKFFVLISKQGHGYLSDDSKSNVPDVGSAWHIDKDDIKDTLQDMKIATKYDAYEVEAVYKMTKKDFL